jgi:hypothetical protein
MVSKGSGLSAAFVFATLIVLSGNVGCGGTDRSDNCGGVTAKADAAEVTYYYLPG